MAVDRIARVMAAKSMKRDVVTEVKLDGAALVKTNGAVEIPAATGEQTGVMTAAQAAALEQVQLDVQEALGKLVLVRVQGTTDMYGKISLPDSTIYPLAALSNTFAITGEYNLRVVNVSTDSAVLAKNTTVDFWIVGLKKA